MTQATRALIIALTAIALLLGGFAWFQYDRGKRAQQQLDLNATRMLHELFSAKRDLRVGQLSGEIVASSQYRGWLLQPSQQTKAPVTVNYLLDLRKIGLRDLHWDAKVRQITVRIPDIEIEKPNIDFIQAEIKQKGFWIGRGAGIVMQRQAVQRMVARANERARDSKNIALARRQAVEFVTQLVSQPLKAVGYGNVEVRVLTPWDEGRSTERWDTSRSLDEVLGNAN